MVEGGNDRIKRFEGARLELWPEGPVQPNETNSNQLTLIRAPGGGGKGRGKGHPVITQQNQAIPRPVIVEGPMKLL